MATLKAINNFTSQKNIAVAGVSRNKKKFGNAIYRELRERGYKLYPVNPKLDEYDGSKCYRSISELPGEITAIVINTKPGITKNLVDEATAKGIKHIWLQQGSADKETIIKARKSETNIITRQCIIMFAEPVKGGHKFHKRINKFFGLYPK